MTQSYSIAVSPLDDSSSIRKKLAAVPIVPNSILGGTLTRQPAYLAPTDLSSVSYSVERLGLAPGRLALLVAEGFTGKTALAQYFGICIAHGKAIFGQFPVTAGKVLHIDQEQDEQQTF
ncbi:MAG TPA: AAA family ATPase, partial [Polyangiaceae bacterium]|nr:AAA family ATPase [Polyangiaceae bacterium]